jgi:hypothetical protein
MLIKAITITHFILNVYNESTDKMIHKTVISVSEIFNIRNMF